MLYREIIAVCSEIHTKHINILCGQNVEFVSVKPGDTHSSHTRNSSCYTKQLAYVQTKHLAISSYYKKAFLCVLQDGTTDSISLQTP
jgi:hypothetical protein